MKLLDQLSDQHVLTLGRFIVGCARAKSSTQWRRHLARCAQQGAFAPFVGTEDAQHLRALIERHGQGFVVGLNTAQILGAANDVAREWGLAPLVLTTTAAGPAPSTSEATA